MTRIIATLLAVVGLQMAAWAAGNPADGKMIANACAGCHGAEGIARQPMHPNLAGQKEKYLIWQLSAFRDGSRPSHIMNEVTKGLTDQNIEDLAAFYAQINICQ